MPSCLLIVYPIDLNPEVPVNINPVVMTDSLPGPDGTLCPSYMGFRRRLQETFETAPEAIAEAGRDFQKVFGRSYEDPLYRYRTDDARFLFVTMGSLASEASEAADILRDQGIPVGVIGVPPVPSLSEPGPGSGSGPSRRAHRPRKSHQLRLRRRVGHRTEGRSLQPQRPSAFGVQLHPGSGRERR